MQPFDAAIDDIEKDMNLAGEDVTLDEDDSQNDKPGKKNTKRDEELVRRFVFFDFETIQNKKHHDFKYGPSFEHEPNLCVVKVTCDDCRKRDFDSDCGRCRQKTLIFQGQTCVTDFCKFLFNKKMTYTTAIAHNAKGFDAHFILKYLQTQGIKPEMICQGNECY